MPVLLIIFYKLLIWTCNINVFKNMIQFSVLSTVFLNILFIQIIFYSLNEYVRSKL